MKEHEDIYVAVVEKYTLDGANTHTLMKHTGHTLELCHHDYYNVVLRLHPSVDRFIQCMREWEAAKDQGSFRLQTPQGRSYL